MNQHEKKINVASHKQLVQTFFLSFAFSQLCVFSALPSGTSPLLMKRMYSKKKINWPNNSSIIPYQSNLTYINNKIWSQRKWDVPWYTNKPTAPSFICTAKRVWISIIAWFMTLSGGCANSVLVDIDKTLLWKWSIYINIKLSARWCVCNGFFSSKGHLGIHYTLDFFFALSIYSVADCFHFDNEEILWGCLM